MLNPEADNDEMEIDLTSVSNGEVADGEYPMTLIDVTRDISKSSGSPMYVWTFQGDESAGNKKFTVYTSLAPAALWKAAEVIAALGLGEVGSKIAFSRRKAIGRKATCVVVNETWEGQKRPKVSRVKPFNGKGADIIPF